MNDKYETLFKVNTVLYNRSRKDGGAWKSLEQLEDETLRDYNDIDEPMIYQCRCGAEFGKDEIHELKTCILCGKTMCCWCENLEHGPHNYNQRYSVCRKED